MQSTEEMTSNSSALRPLIAGDVIFESKPVFHTIFRSYKKLNCDNCLKGSSSLKRCSNCRQMYYCGKRCQKKDWKYHKNECEVLAHKKFRADQCSEEEISLIRLWLTIKSDPTFAEKKYKLFDGSDVCLNDIEVDIKRFCEEIDYLVEFYLICNHFNDLELDFNREELLRWFAIVRCSPIFTAVAFYRTNGIISEMTDRLVYAVYPQMCSVSHSCVPNSGCVLNGLSLQLRAIKSIAVGTQITRNFVDLAKYRTDRQNELKKVYLIDCKCLKCERNLDSDIDYQKFIYFRNRLLDKFIQIFVAQPIELLLDWEELKPLGEEMFFITKSIFGEYHPERSSILSLWMLVSFCIKRIQKPSLTIDRQLADEIKRLFCISYGEAHPHVIYFNTFCNIYE